MLALGALAVQAGAGAQIFNSAGIFTDPTSALIGSMIQQNLNTMNMPGTSTSGADPARLSAGQRIIEAGQATTLFEPTPYRPPYVEWARQSGTSLERQQWEYAEQMNIWNDELRRRGANPRDMAHVCATAFVLSFEGYTGARASDAGWRAQVQDCRKYYLGDRTYQGATPQEKAAEAHDLSLKGYAVFGRQEYQRTGEVRWLEGAKRDAAAFFEEYWTSLTPGLSDTEDYLRWLGNHGSTPAPVQARWDRPTPHASAGAARPAADSSAAPQVSLKDAIARTTFRRVSPTVVPAQMAKLAMTPQEAQQTRELAEHFIALAREQLAGNKAAELPVDNVARTTAYAFGQLYTLGLARAGQALGEVQTRLTAPALAALGRKTALGLAGQAEFVKLTDAQKQQYAELLLLMPTFFVGSYLLAQEDGDLEAQRSAIQMARTSFKEIFGVMPEAFDLSGL